MKKKNIKTLINNCILVCKVGNGTRKTKATDRHKPRRATSSKNSNRLSIIL